MKRLLPAALAAACVAAAPGHSQSSGKLRLFQLPPPDAPREPNRYSYDPATDEAPKPRPKGARMLVGTAVAPGALMGVGLFSSTPRSRGSADYTPDFEPRKKRKVGVGLLMKF